MQLLAKHMQQLQNEGAAYSAMAMQEQSGSVPLFDALLPVLFSSKEVDDTLAESRASGKADWVSYLRETLWPFAHAVGDSEALSRSADEWCCLSPDEGAQGFAPVQLPESTHLPRMDSGQVASLHGQYAERQAALHRLLLAHVHVAAKEAFQFFYDVIVGVAVVSQLPKSLAAATSPGELMRHMLLPFLWRWRPSQVMVDDFDRITDGFFAIMPSNNAVVVSTSTELPPLQRERLTLPRTLLETATGELQKHHAVATAVLSTSLRCPDESVQSILSQLCVAPTPTTATTAMGTETPSFPFDALLKAKAPGAQAVADGSSHAETPLPGLVSFSPIEFWTHAVPLERAADEDAKGALYLVKYWAQYSSASELDVCIYSSSLSASSSARATVGAQSGGGAGYRRAPLIQELQGPKHAQECDFAVVCLSSISQMAQSFLNPSGTTAEAAERQRSDERYKMWVVLQEREEQLFTRLLQQWLWSILVKARRGAVIVCSKELSLRVELLRKMESYVSKLRQALAPSEQLRYWLPEESEGCALALKCPDHFLCKRTATLQQGDDASGTPQPVVTLRGTTACTFMCLKRFRRCDNASHVCLRACHAAAENGSPHHRHHDSCPFPCGIVRECGHTCNRVCGEPCGRCSFRGLQELRCGQRVVSGADPSGEVLYKVFNHFQTLDCGDSPRPCETPVQFVCPRCGVNDTLPCHRVYPSGVCVATEEPNPGLTERQCHGCVELFNKVAPKYNVSTLQPLPSDVGADGGGDIHRPLAAELPAEGQEELRKKFNVSREKAKFGAKIQALQITTGKQGSNSDHLMYESQYELQKAKQQEEISAHREELKAAMLRWKKMMMDSLESQSALKTEAETIIPQLKAEAREEAERQRSFFL